MLLFLSYIDEQYINFIFFITSFISSWLLDLMQEISSVIMQSSLILFLILFTSSNAEFSIFHNASTCLAVILQAPKNILTKRLLNKGTISHVEFSFSRGLLFYVLIYAFVSRLHTYLAHLILWVRFPPRPYVGMKPSWDTRKLCYFTWLFVEPCNYDFIWAPIMLW